MVHNILSTEKKSLIIHTNSWFFICSPLFYVEQLEKISNINSAGVDWERSFYLNLIAHTSYTVTVAICRYVSASSVKILQVFI